MSVTYRGAAQNMRVGREVSIAVLIAESCENIAPESGWRSSIRCEAHSTLLHYSDSSTG